MNKIKSILLLAMALSAACVQMISHNQDIAASSAVEFMNLAFVDKNFAAASQKLAPASRNAQSVKEVEDMATRLHPNGGPTMINAVEYEPIPSQKAMRIFLVGENNDGTKYFYMVVMQGTVEEGYGPSEIHRKDDPFPPSSTRKPLPIVRTN